MNKLVTQLFLFFQAGALIFLLTFTTKSYAEFYVFNGSSCSGCNSCNNCTSEYRPVRHYRHHAVRHHYYHPRYHYVHRVHYPQNTYSITKYTFSSEPACGCQSVFVPGQCHCGQYQPAHYEYQSVGPMRTVVYQETYTESFPRKNYDYDRRTRDDVGCNLNIDN